MSHWTQESDVTSFSFFGILKMNVSESDEKREGFLVDVIHLLDDAAQTKAKLNHFCSYFSQNGSQRKRIEIRDEQ